MNIFKLVSIIVFLSIYLSINYFDRNDEQVSNKVIDSNVFINEYFGKYSKNFKETTQKPETYIKVFFIDKRKIEEDIFTITEKLKMNGWRLTNEAKGYYEFCYGKNYSLTIIIPQVGGTIKPNGSQVYYHDINSADIILNYLKYGVYSCLNTQ